MRPIERIAAIENAERIAVLVNFRKLVIEYFINSKIDGFLRKRVEHEQAKAARVKINRLLPTVGPVIGAAHVHTVITWTPPPAIGGYIQHVELIHNLFNLSHFDIPASQVIDVLDQAIGVYESNERRAKVRLYNPFYYLGLLLDWIAKSPFSIARRAGFNASGLENSVVGKAVRLVVYLAGAAASVLTVIHFLGVSSLW